MTADGRAEGTSDKKLIGLLRLLLHLAGLLFLLCDVVLVFILRIWIAERFYQHSRILSEGILHVLLVVHICHAVALLGWFLVDLCYGVSPKWPQRAVVLTVVGVALPPLATFGLLLSQW